MGEDETLGIRRSEFTATCSKRNFARLASNAVNYSSNHHFEIVDSSGHENRINDSCLVKPFEIIFFPIRWHVWSFPKQDAISIYVIIPE